MGRRSSPTRRPGLRAPASAVLAVVAALAVGTGLAGCGEDADAAGGAAVGTDQGVPAQVACPSTAKPVAVPAGVTAPLPGGTVVVAAQRRSDGRTVLTGVVPAAEKDVLAQLQQQYRAAGLQLTDGETEEHDAESNFSGTGVTGRWGIRALSDCSPEATRIDLVVRSG